MSCTLICVALYIDKYDILLVNRGLIFLRIVLLMLHPSQLTLFVCRANAIKDKANLVTAATGHLCSNLTALSGMQQIA